MDTQTKKKLSPEAILLIIALCAAVMLLITVLAAMPYLGRSEDPQAQVSRRPHATAPPQETEPPTEGPTEPPMPPPEANPYDRLDFQFDGRYLSCLRTETWPGVDVSTYQGDIDWEQVASSGIQFAIVRVGYRGYGQAGRMVEDENAKKNIQGALDAGLKVGVYFFSQATSVEEAQEEARFVLERIKDYTIEMPVVFDWEYISEEARTANVGKRTLTDCYLAFSRMVEEAGYTPMAYFNWYQSTHMMYLSELEEYPFWLALYSNRMNYPYRIEMWQYTCTGRVPGIDGDVDINVYFPKG